MESKKTKLVDLCTTGKSFRTDLLLEMEGFRQHVKTATTQYEQIQILKKNLSPNEEMICQMDYSENWAGKYPKEISSVYFDNDQLTLHPMSIQYTDAEGKAQKKSYVGLCADGTHTLASTYAFIIEMIKRVIEFLPNLQVIHFITDSPSSQYRNRSAVELVRRFPEIFLGIRATWTWLETGHGKGPCDGVGGAMKKKADNLVKSGHVMRTAKEFHKVLTKAGIKSQLMLVPQHILNDKKAEVKAWNAPAAKGVMAMHGLVYKEGTMYMRHTSCFEPCCWSEMEAHLSCDGWRLCNGQKQKRSNHVKPAEEEDDMPLSEIVKTTPKNADEDDMPLSEIVKTTPKNADEDDMPLSEIVKTTPKNADEDDMPLSEIVKTTPKNADEDDMPLSEIVKTTPKNAEEDDMPLSEIVKTTPKNADEDDMPLSEIVKTTLKNAEEDDMPLSEIVKTTPKNAEEDDMPLSEIVKTTPKNAEEDDMPLSEIVKTTPKNAEEDDMPLSEIVKTTPKNADEDDMPLSEIVKTTPKNAEEDDMPLSEIVKTTPKNETTMETCNHVKQPQVEEKDDDEMTLVQRIRKMKREPISDGEAEMPTVHKIRKIKQEPVSEDDEDVPLAEIKKKKETIKVGDFVVVIYDEEWYPVKVTGFKDGMLLISYMTREKGHWKWGPKDHGSVLAEAILQRIEPPMRQSRGWQLRPHDLKSVKKSFKFFLTTMTSLRKV